VSPQSHLANARTNSKWSHTVSSQFKGSNSFSFDYSFVDYSKYFIHTDKSQQHTDLKKVTGREYWASDPVRVEVKDGKFSVIFILKPFL
jgi:hypothetical protein